MTTNEYVPSDDDVRIEYVLAHQGLEAQLDAGEAYDRWLAAHDARVRRDAERGAIDGLIADKAHMAVLLRAENGGNVEDVLTHYRDTHCPIPEETP